MTTYLTMSQIYWNASLVDFFFRTQAQNTFNDLMDKVADKQSALQQIDDVAGCNGMDLDEFEEMCYNDEIEEIADYFGLVLA